MVEGVGRYGAVGRGVVVWGGGVVLGGVRWWAGVGRRGVVGWGGVVWGCMGGGLCE